MMFFVYFTLMVFGIFLFMIIGGSVWLGYKSANYVRGVQERSMPNLKKKCDLGILEESDLDHLDFDDFVEITEYQREKRKLF